MWVGVAALLASMHASANIRELSECERTALAAYQAAQIVDPKVSSREERYFINLSRYLLEQARGQRGRFLYWYRQACAMERAPKYIRVKGDRVVVGGAA